MLCICPLILKGSAWFLPPEATSAVKGIQAEVTGIPCLHMPNLLALMLGRPGAPGMKGTSQHLHFPPNPGQRVQLDIAKTCGNLSCPRKQSGWGGEG